MAHFSRRQAQIMELVAEGLPHKQIAATLDLSIATIRTHLRRLYKDMAIHSRAGAVSRWLHAGRVIPP